MMKFFQQRKTAWTKARKAPLEGCGSLAVSPSGEKESPARLSEPRLSHLPTSQHPHHSPTTPPPPPAHPPPPPPHPPPPPARPPPPPPHPPPPPARPPSQPPHHTLTNPPNTRITARPAPQHPHCILPNPPQGPWAVQGPPRQIGEEGWLPTRVQGWGPRSGSPLPAQLTRWPPPWRAP